MFVCFPADIKTINYWFIDRLWCFTSSSSFSCRSSSVTRSFSRLFSSSSSVWTNPASFSCSSSSCRFSSASFWSSCFSLAHSCSSENQSINQSINQTSNVKWSSLEKHQRFHLFVCLFGGKHEWLTELVDLQLLLRHTAPPVLQLTHCSVDLVQCSTHSLTHTEQRGHTCLQLWAQHVCVSLWRLQ